MLFIHLLFTTLYVDSKNIFFDLQLVSPIKLPNFDKPMTKDCKLQSTQKPLPIT